MQREKNPQCRRSTPGFWSLLLGPVVFAIWFVLHFQGEVRGASFHLKMLLLVPVALAAWAMVALRSFFRSVEEEYHRIVASALLASAFFGIWELGTVPMEQLYILVDGYEGRRIYSDDSGMGDALSLGKAPAAIATAMFCGLVLGCAWGVLTSVLQRIFRPRGGSVG